MLPYLFGPFLVGTLLALVAGWLLIPVLRKLKARQTISTDAPKSHLKKGGTPTMGGAFLLLAGLVGALIYPRPGGEMAPITAVLLATIGFGLVGFIDDLLIVVRGKNLGLRAREKLLGQFIVGIAFAVWWAMHTPAWTYFSPEAGAVSVQAGAVQGAPAWWPWVLGAYHVLLMVGMSNAVNLTDGLDGLAGGVSLPVWLTLGLMAAFGAQAHPWFGANVADHGLIIFCGAMAGATLGYLWYNAHPAQVFMGDTGSLAIGGGIAVVAIAMRLEWIVLVAALVHIVEAGSVTLQVISFKTTGKRIFKMSPLHHHFELCEWPETRVVARFVIASALCCLTALLIYFRG